MPSIGVDWPSTLLQWLFRRSPIARRVVRWALVSVDGVLLAASWRGARAFVVERITQKATTLTESSSPRAMMAPNENAAPNTQPKAIAAPTLHVHAAGNSFIGNLEIDAHTATLEAPVANAQWCLVMDNSASMGRWSPRRGSNPRLARRRLLIQHSSRWLRSAALIHDVFPHMLRRMGVPEDERLHLILFSNAAERFSLRADELCTFSLPRPGSTVRIGRTQCSFRRVSLTQCTLELIAEPSRRFPTARVAAGARAAHQHPRPL